MANLSSFETRWSQHEWTTWVVCLSILEVLSGDNSSGQLKRLVGVTSSWVLLLTIKQLRGNKPGYLEWRQGEPHSCDADGAGS